MEKITVNEIPEMFDQVAIVFADKKDELCEMDAAMGDGDLGLTMSKGYGALPGFLRDNAAEGDIGKQLMKSGMKMQNEVPSTMGTHELWHYGGRQAFKGKVELVPADIAAYVTAFAAGIKKRGKCELGDRTILDSVHAGAEKAQALVDANPDASFRDVISAAVEGAHEGVEATKDMLPKYGKAAVHAAKAKGVVDQGALAGYYMLVGLQNYFEE